MEPMIKTDINSILANYRIHSIGPEDSQAINRMLLDIEAVDQRNIIDTLNDRQRDLNDPETNPATDSLVVLTPTGQAAAMGWVFTPLEAGQEYVTFLWGEVHPQHRRQGLGDYVLSWMEKRADQILSGMPVDRPHSMRVFVKSGLQDRVALFEKHGFHAVRSFYRMQRDLHQPIDPPDLQPQHILIGWDSGRNEEGLRVINEAFSDHWGFIPMAAANWRLWVIDHEDFRPDLSFMVLSAETGEMVGMSVNKVFRAENEARGIREGWIMDLCVRKPWRKQGLATALLNASMQAFKADGLETAGLGVDTENLTGALRLYKRLGFQPVMRNETFSKPVKLE
jgi:mycothiol synthase